jgi:hypothetical protein
MNTIQSNNVSEIKQHSLYIAIITLIYSRALTKICSTVINLKQIHGVQLILSLLSRVYRTGIVNMFCCYPLRPVFIE